VELGADFASVVSPWFAMNTQEGLYRHYKTVAQESDLPILVYNMPARTGVNVHPNTMQKLNRIENIVGIKDSSGNFDNMQQYLEIPESKLSVLSGNDSLILPCLLAGGKGGISGIANVLPEMMVQIYSAWAAGDLKEAWRVQRSIRPLRDCMAQGNPNSVVKRAAYFVGQNLGPVRAPFDIQDEKLDQSIIKALEMIKKAKE
jgi:4-hydroxy-tetrahydrodipicolinate synthase